MNLDICTTATLRPMILAQTLDSFFENMLGGAAQHHFAYRHVINIDCIGDDCDPGAVLAESERRFGATRVVARVAQEPSFPRAFRWVWAQAQADYALHLEDDWIMLHAVDLLDMVSFLDAHEDFALLRFNRFASRRETTRQWRRHVPWNGDLGIFEVPEAMRGELGWSGNPSLVRREFIAEMLPYVSRDDFDPEKQLHLRDAASLVARWRIGIWQRQESGPTVRDAGREWCAEHRWHKHRGAGFTRWERMQEA